LSSEDSLLSFLDISVKSLLDGFLTVTLGKNANGFLVLIFFLCYMISILCSLVLQQLMQLQSSLQKRP
jgi:hypothetical protein